MQWAVIVTGNLIISLTIRTHDILILIDHRGDCRLQDCALY